MSKRLGMAAVGFVFLIVVLSSSSLFTQGCSDKSATAPVTVTQPVTFIATPPPNTVGGRDWGYTTLGAAFGGRSNEGALSLGNKMWVLGGFISGLANDVWSSTNGSTWTQVLANNGLTPASGQFTERSNAGAVVYNSKMWLLGGFGGPSTTPLNDVWSSSDGVSWTNNLADTASPGVNQFSERFFAGSLVYNNKIWIIGGTPDASNSLNDVWSSPDGATWTKVLADTGSPGGSQFSRRFGQVCLVYNGQMWVIGGTPNGTTTHLNDAWYSTDGITWTQVMINNGAPGANQFSQRNYSTGLVYGGAMWIIGGQDASGRLNDVWYSTSGNYWTQINAAAAFPARDQAAGVVYNNAMWLIGGVGTGGGVLGDVWQSPF